MDVLFRALNQKEIDEGCILIPRSTEPFMRHFRVGTGCCGDRLVSSKNAVLDHQLYPGNPTRGISTTTSRRIAFDKYGKRLGVIAIIDRSKLLSCGIKEHVVKQELPLSRIKAPEDEEIILVSDHEGYFPGEIIYKIIRVYCDGATCF